jgi:hypothetical protein
MARVSDRKSFLVLPAVAVLSVTVAFVGHLSLTRRGQPTEALQLTVERSELATSDGFAQVTHEAVLFSRQRALYQIRMDHSPLLIPMSDRDQRFLLQDSSVTAETEIERWGVENIYAIKTVEFPLIAQVRSGVGYASIEIANGTDRTLQNTVLLRGGFPEPIGTIQPGGREEHVSLVDAPGEWSDIVWKDLVPSGPMNPNQAQLLHDIARTQRQSREDVPELLVVGWLADPLLHAAVTPQFMNTISLHVVIMRIPLTGEGG